MSYGDEHCECNDDFWCGCLDAPALEEIAAIEYARSQSRAVAAVEAEMNKPDAPDVAVGVWIKSIGTGAVIGALSLLLPMPPAYGILIGGFVAALALPAFNLNSGLKAIDALELVPVDKVETEKPQPATPNINVIKEVAVRPGIDAPEPNLTTEQPAKSLEANRPLADVLPFPQRQTFNEPETEHHQPTRKTVSS